MSERCENCRWWQPRKTIWQWLKEAAEKPATMGTCPQLGGLITRCKFRCSEFEPKPKDKTDGDS